MIVDPDFLDHWRTRMLVDALGGDELVPLCLIRLWAHCQQRKGDRFEMPAAGLKAQCRYTGDAQAFEAALIEAKFVARDGEWIHILGWAEQNASLLAAWENGQKGGRPRKEPNQNPRVMRTEPAGNPTETHGEPNANPDETDKRREEKISPSLRSGETRGKRAPVVTVPVSELVEAGMDAQTADEFIAHKHRLKAPLTPRAWADHRRESESAGWSVQQAAEKVMAKGWKGFEAKYVQSERPPSRAAPQSFRESDRRADEAKVAFLTGRKPQVFEATDVTPRSLDRTDLLETVGDVRPSLPSPVRRS